MNLWLGNPFKAIIYFYHQQKCRQYWPEKVKDKIKYGDIDVTFEKEELWPDYQVRTFKIEMVCNNSSVSSCKQHMILIRG